MSGRPVRLAPSHPVAPSTGLRPVPLPRFAREESRTAPRQSSPVHGGGDHAQRGGGGGPSTTEQVCETDVVAWRSVDPPHQQSGDSYVGRDGMLSHHDAYVGRKSEWATWTPPKEMIQRQPEAAHYAKGMPGGLDNPVGPRTLHLYQDGKYTLFTIYANHDPDTIGHGITSGCVGLLSQDMIDLYDRTPVKTKVVVLPA